MTPGSLMIGLQGPELTADERELLQHPRVAGAILFQRNLVDWEQIRALVEDIRALSTPGLVAVDQEGGRVQRIGAPCTLLPPLRRLGEWHDRAPAAATAGAEQLGWLMAAELRSAGIDLSFAPVLDLDHGISAVIGDRAFHGDPDAVAALGGAWCRGMRAAGMASCGKHFPGHGAVTADSHTDLPVDHRPELELRGADLAVFERLIDEGALTAIMTAHVVYPQLDNQPATFSSTWIHRTLREEMNFQGVVVGDDLGMEAAASVGDLVARAEAAVHAGCDLVMLCNELDGIGKVLDALGAEVPASTAERLQRLQGETPPAPELAALQQHPEWQRANALAQSLLT